MMKTFFSFIAIVALQIFSISAYGQSTTMQIVAHQDDDILFMNPEVQNSLKSGSGSITVFLTAGQSIGTEDGAQSREVFAAYRQEGARAAYAQMMGVPNTPSTWERKTISLPNGKLAEVNTLLSNTAIKLIFMNLSEGGDTLTINSIENLYEGRIAGVYTIIPTNNPIVNSYTYTRSNVIDSLVYLLNTYRPNLVRSLDSHPYACHKCDGNEDVSFENHDHIFTARFAEDAVKIYNDSISTSQARQFIPIRNFLGYSIANHQGNLGANQYTQKRETSEAYMAWDKNYQQYSDSYLPFYGATYSRYTSGSNWLQQQSSGLLAAFSITSRGLNIWRENGAPGAWVGPTLQAVRGLMPGLAFSKNPDGRLQVFALRIAKDPSNENVVGAAQNSEIITSIEDSANSLSFTNWTSLGKPTVQCYSGAECNNSMGAPTAITATDGSIFVFIKNEQQGVSVRRKYASGAWSSWQNIGGNYLNGNPSVELSANGKIHVAAVSRLGKIYHWIQQSALSNTFTLDSSFVSDRVAMPPGLIVNKYGKMVMVYRKQGTADINTLRENESDGTWNAVENNISSHGGYTQLSLSKDSINKSLYVFSINDLGGISIAKQSDISPSMFSWARLGGAFYDSPSANKNNLGEIIVAGIGLDGQLYVSKQYRANDTPTFGNLTPVGN